MSRARARGFIRLCAAGLVLFADAASAHHSFAMFDQLRQVRLSGTVREFQWTNPHSWLALEVVDLQGKATLWQIELNSPNNLKRQGWKATTLKPGDQATLLIHPLRDGRKGGLFLSATFADGTVLGEPTGSRGPINVP